MTVSEVRKRTAEKMAAPSAELVCRYCKAPTPGPVLSMLGARCKPCFDAYVRAPEGLRPLPEGASIPDDVPRMHRWAHRLMARRDAGEKLNHAQVHCLTEFERNRHSRKGTT